MPGIRTHTVRCLERRCSAAAAGRGASAKQHACQFAWRKDVLMNAPAGTASGRPTPSLRAQRSNSVRRAVSEPGVSPGCCAALALTRRIDGTDGNPNPPSRRQGSDRPSSKIGKSWSCCRTCSRPNAGLPPIQAPLLRNRAAPGTTPSAARHHSTDDPALLGHPELAAGAAAIALGLGPRGPGSGRLRDLGRFRRHGAAGLRARSEKQGRNQNCSAHQHTRVHGQDPSPGGDAGGWHQPEVAGRRKADAARNRIRPARSCIRVNARAGG
ncbi:hypothetical protein JHFBIEKO_1101 [Methylobacterium mesophilicum]|nr:hypothetical protein JHFBIEKO_1101 [Methylobacterium mesophilicum]